MSNAGPLGLRMGKLWSLSGGTGIFDWTPLCSPTVENVGSVGLSENQPKDCAVTPDGKTFYVIGFDSDVVLRYDTATAYDLDNASLTNSWTVGNGSGIAFTSDGTQGVTIRAAATDNCSTLLYSTPYDYDTRSLSSAGVISLNLTELGANPITAHISANDAYLYVCGLTGEVVARFPFGTPGDVSTISTTADKSVDNLNTAGNTLGGVWLSNDGKTMVVSAAVYDGYVVYTLSTPFDPETATLECSFTGSPVMVDCFGIHVVPSEGLFISTNDLNNTLNVYAIEGLIQ